MNNVIFIEGVSGVGKTTAATHLHAQLRNMGTPAVCHLEGDRENPLDPFKGTYPPAMPLTEFTETYLHCWQRFMENHPKNLLILDGTLLHHQVNDLIRGYDAPNRIIVEHLAALLHSIRHVKPIVFYLSSGDVGRRLAQAREARGQPDPTKNQILFWENRKQVDLYALDRLPVQSSLLDIDGGWGPALEAMTERIAPFTANSV